MRCPWRRFRSPTRSEHSRCRSSSLVGFVIGSLTVSFDVAYQSYLPSLVGRDELVSGNSFLELSRSSAQVAGPGVGGVLVGALTAPYAIVVDAVSFVGSALLLLRIRSREPTTGARRESEHAPRAPGRARLRPPTPLLAADGCDDRDDELLLEPRRLRDPRLRGPQPRHVARGDRPRDHAREHRRRRRRASPRRGSADASASVRPSSAQRCSSGLRCSSCRSPREARRFRSSSRLPPLDRRRDDVLRSRA